MSHSVPCNACGAEFSISDDLFARKVAGRVVSVECRNCRTPIHIDGTQGRAAVVSKSQDLPTMPSASPDPRSLGDDFAPEPAPELLVEVPDRVGLLAGTRMPLTSPAPPGARENREPTQLPEPKKAPEGSAIWVVSDRDDMDHELSYEALRLALRKGQFDKKSIAWREGMPEWLPLGRIDELSTLLAQEGLGPVVHGRSNLSGSTMLGIGQVTPPNPIASAPRPVENPLQKSAADAQKSAASHKGAAAGGSTAQAATMSSMVPTPTVPIAAVPRPERGNPSRLPGAQETAAAGRANVRGLREVAAPGPIQPMSAVVLEEGEVESLPPSTAQAAMQALGQVTLADSSEALPPSSAAAALEALSETLLDEDVKSVHNPVAADEETIPLETLQDDEVESLHDPLPFRANVAQVSAPFAGDEETTSSSRQNTIPIDTGLLDAVEEEPPPHVRRMRANPLESSPISSIPGLTQRRSRAGLWLGLSALVGVAAGGWYYFGRPLPGANRSTLAQAEAPNSAAQRAAARAENTVVVTPVLPPGEGPAADDATAEAVAPTNNEAPSAESATNPRAGTGEGRARRSRKSAHNDEESGDSPSTEAPSEPAPAAEPEAVAAAPTPAEEAAPAPVAKVAPPFDKASAQSALAAAAALAATCRKEGDPAGSTNVTVTLAPSGKATAANVVGPFGGTRVGGCIAQRMRAVRVPAFTGAHVTLQKTVVLR